MSTAMSARPTRRTLVRSVAWSVPVVALAATAPAFAASTASSSLTAGKADKWGNGQVKHVSWDVTLVNGPIEIDKVVITFQYVPQGGGTFSTFTMGGYSPTDTTWTYVVNTSVSPYTVTATHEDNIPANASRSLHVDFAGQDASSGDVTANATITYVGGTSEPKQIGPIGWGPGSQHSHVGVTTP